MSAASGGNKGKGAKTPPEESSISIPVDLDSISITRPADAHPSLSRQPSLNSIGGLSLNPSAVPSSMRQQSAMPQSASTLHIRTMGDSSDSDDEVGSTGEGMMMDMLRSGVRRMKTSTHSLRHRRRKSSSNLTPYSEFAKRAARQSVKLTSSNDSSAPHKAKVSQLQGPVTAARKGSMLLTFARPMDSESDEDGKSGSKDSLSTISGSSSEDEEDELDQDVTATLHPDFDVSPYHLNKLFTLLDTNGDGELAVEQVHEAFKAMNAFPHLTHDQLSQVIRAMDANHNNTISLDEFVSGMQEYAARSFPGTGDDYSLLCIDYSPQFLKRLVVGDPTETSSNTLHAEFERTRANSLNAAAVPAAAVTSYNRQDSVPPVASAGTLSIPSSRVGFPEVFGIMPPKPLKTVRLDAFLKSYMIPLADTRVRWLSFVGTNASAFIRIANKLKLHPLAVCAVMMYAGHMLNARDVRERVSDVLEGRPRCKFESFGEDRYELVWTKITLKEKAPERVKLEQISIFYITDLRTMFTVEKTPGGFTGELLERVRYAGSKLRLNDARYLIHALIDSSVEAVFPIISLYRQQLSIMYRKLHSGRDLDMNDIRDIQRIYRQAVHLSDWLRPMCPVIVQIKDVLGQNDQNLKRHWGDVMANVEALREQASNMVKQAKSVNEDFVNQQQYKMNRVMYFLTMVTTVFIPGQFLSGVYGMNFEYMPELGWKPAYFVFWLVFLTIASTVLFTFYRWRLWSVTKPF